MASVPDLCSANYLYCVGGMNSTGFNDLPDLSIIEMVMCLGVIYIVSYGSILVVWCILRIYLVSMGNMMMVLIGIIFYGGLIVVTILIVMPNGNAHYYYNSLIIVWAVVRGAGSMYLGVLTVVIVMIILVF